MKLGVFVSDYVQKTDTLDRISPDGVMLVANGVYHATIKEGGSTSSVSRNAECSVSRRN